MKKKLVWIISPFFFILLFLFWSVSPSNKWDGEILKVDPIYFTSSGPDEKLLKIVTWNLSFLFGRGSEGDDYYENRNSSYFDLRLHEASELLKKLDADIVFIQEIDFSSSRSHSVNQAVELAKNAGYPYVAIAPSWNINFLLFPLHSPFGKLYSGGAVISRYPIISQKIKLLNKPQNNPWWYNLFYLHRYFQEIEIDLSHRKINVVNLHLEAFDKQNRQDQIKELIQNHSKADFLVGDFNMVTPEVSRKKFKKDDYAGDESYLMMKKVSQKEIFEIETSTSYTFPAWAPDRRLDYIFYNKELLLVKAEVIQTNLSDHLPIKAIFQF